MAFRKRSIALLGPYILLYYLELGAPNIHTWEIQDTRARWKIECKDIAKEMHCEFTCNPHWQ